MNKPIQEDYEKIINLLASGDDANISMAKMLIKSVGISLPKLTKMMTKMRAEIKSEITILESKLYQLKQITYPLNKMKEGLCELELRQLYPNIPSYKIRTAIILAGRHDYKTWEISNKYYIFFKPEQESHIKELLATVL